MPQGIGFCKALKIRRITLSIHVIFILFSKEAYGLGTMSCHSMVTQGCLKHNNFGKFKGSQINHEIKYDFIQCCV